MHNCTLLTVDKLHVTGSMTTLLLCHYAGSHKGPLSQLPASDVQRLQQHTINRTSSWSLTTQEIEHTMAQAAIQ